MSVSHLEILVEEPSMEALLNGLLPRVLGELSYDIHVHQGKPDLLAKLASRLRGYAHWIADTTRILIIVDRDNEDCVKLKRQLEATVAGTKLATRTTCPARWHVATRIAIEELEAWYFGDWSAVRAAYPRVGANVPTRSEFRDPDAIQGGTWQAFERVLQASGYFAGGLRKIEAARTLAPHLVAERNASRSFQAFHRVIRELSGAQP